jgi:hypothetical protein
VALRQQFVQLGKAGGFHRREIRSRGRPNVVSTGVFKLRNGMPVVVDNTLAPEFKLPPVPTMRKANSMNITDIFIKRPVLALVVSLVIIIAGLQACSPERAPVSPQRQCRRSRSPPFMSAPAPSWCADSSPLRWSGPSPPPTASIT